jgi:Kef-type K+ transport system membrane component KefB
MDAKGLETLLVVTLIAALTLIVCAALPRLRIPQVVVLIFSGILIGSHGLGLADTSSIKLLSAIIAVVAVAGLGSVDYVRDFVPIGLALTTTALGTLLPILHDNDMLSGKFGRYILVAGAVGELFPILAISLFLTNRGEFALLFRSRRCAWRQSCSPPCHGSSDLLSFARSLSRASGRRRRRPCAGQSACCCCFSWVLSDSAWMWCWELCSPE